MLLLLLWDSRIPKLFSSLSIHASGPSLWPTAPSLQHLPDPAHPWAHLQRIFEVHSGLDLSADGHVPRNDNGVRFHSQAVDHHRVLPLMAVIPGKATELGELRTIRQQEKKRKEKLTKGTLTG